MTSAKTQKFPEILGERLLRLARESIGHRLGLIGSIDDAGLEDPSFLRSCGSFVTLKNRGDLRGCIGNLEGSGNIAESIRKNALSAAFHDHRFTPLTPPEFDTISLEISILSEPQELEYQDSEELLDRLRPGVDGVILQVGSGRATFLPQVWDQLPDPEQFLDHLSQKAGLSGQAWRTQHPAIFCYQVQSFKENQ